MDDDELDWAPLGGDAREVSATIDAVARLSALAENRRRSDAMVAAQQHSSLRGM